MNAVAIIGAGPAGLAAARYLASEGFAPVLFECGASIGGQWSGDRSRSGVWPSMRTNTSRILTAFSDLPHPDGSPTYPTGAAIRPVQRRATLIQEPGQISNWMTAYEMYRSDGAPAHTAGKLTPTSPPSDRVHVVAARTGLR